MSQRDDLSRPEQFHDGLGTFLYDGHSEGSEKLTDDDDVTASTDDDDVTASAEATASTILRKATVTL